MQELLAEIKKCKECESKLSHGCNPVLTADINSKIVIIGQAPGIIVHKTGIPWNDKSGDTLRKWMGIDTTVFYDEKLISIIPMGFCYPGKGKTGDLPPRKECAPLWHSKLLTSLNNVELILLVGAYAQAYYLQNDSLKNVTNRVMNFESYLPKYFVLPHPSPRNNIWMKKNPWFHREVVPQLRFQVKSILKL